jgi:RND family efflux transporter MFP subunit
MKIINVQLPGVAFLLLLATSCGNSNKDNKASVTDKKAELQKLKEQQRKLEQEIAAADSGNKGVAKLVAVQALNPQAFNHSIDLQGSIEAEITSNVSSKGMGGQVKAIYIKQGDYVRKGQLLMKLEDGVLRQSVIAARQGLGTLKTQLDLAKTVYERQKSLFDKGIGAEVQLLQAKANYEGLQNSLNAAAANVLTAETQLNTTNVFADISGVADEVSIKVGELFTGGSPMAPGIKIVNTSVLKAVAEIPENYLTRIRKGTPVVVEISDNNQKISSVVSVVSQSINVNTRSFTAECRIGANKNLKPNQSALLKFQDYASPNAMVVPVNTVQSDEKGKYVFVMETGAGQKTYARRKQVVTGELYGDLIEIKNGLQNGQQLITQGYQNLYDGQLIASR